jgi:hypothetical protein
MNPKTDRILQKMLKKLLDNCSESYPPISHLIMVYATYFYKNEVRKCTVTTVITVTNIQGWGLESETSHSIPTELYLSVCDIYLLSSSHLH